MSPRSLEAAYWFKGGLCGGYIGVHSVQGLGFLKIGGSFSSVPITTDQSTTPSAKAAYIRLSVCGFLVSMLKDDGGHIKLLGAMI